MRQITTPFLIHCLRGRRFRLMIIILLLVLPACQRNISLPFGRKTPTPTLTPTTASVAFQIAVTIIVPTSTATPSPTSTPTATVTPSPTATPTATVTETPTSVPTATLPLSGPVITPIANTTITSTIAAATPLTPSGDIGLVELPDGIVLPEDVGRVEFKWVWHGHDCDAMPDGYGFDVRIWPEGPALAPLGVTDATDQKGIYCDPISGTFGYEVGNLRGAPGVAELGVGRFRWDIALVQLNPYKPIDVSGSRIFDLPPGPATATPTPGLPRAVEAGGPITLVEPPYEAPLPVGATQVEFTWRWGQTCQFPPLGYGFELRIWPEGSQYAPMGAMGDAKLAQSAIACNQATGVFGYRTPDLTRTPALTRVATGRFQWDVILVQLEPYTVVVASSPSIFTVQK